MEKPHPQRLARLARPLRPSLRPSLQAHTLAGYGTASENGQPTRAHRGLGPDDKHRRRQRRWGPPKLHRATAEKGRRRSRTQGPGRCARQCRSLAPGSLTMYRCCSLGRRLTDGEAWRRHGYTAADEGRVPPGRHRRRAEYDEAEETSRRVARQLTVSPSSDNSSPDHPAAKRLQGADGHHREAPPRALC